MRTTGTPQAEQPRRVAVFGHANMEIVIPAGPFPISYEPDRVLTGGQISVGVSGTAYNEAIENAYVVGSSVVRELAQHWPIYERSAPMARP